MASCEKPPLPPDCAELPTMMALAMSPARGRVPEVSALALAGALALWSVALAACGGGGQPSIGAFCERLEAAFGPEGALAADYSSDPGAAEAVVRELESIRRVAPLEIEPSLAVVNETAGIIIATASGARSGAIDVELLRQSEDAATRLARYSAGQCGLDLDWQSPAVPVEPDKISGEVDLNIPG